MTPSRRLLTAALALACTACERGCASKWLGERGIDTSPRGSGAPPSQPRFDLMGVDCPDGLARCAGGVVEVSRAHRYSVPCNEAPERCACPWERLGDCERGCAAEGVEIDAPRVIALTQLCAPPATPEAGATFSRSPPSAAAVTGCDGAYACMQGMVVVCGPPARAVAECSRGCAREGQSIDEEGVSATAAVALLCAR